MKHYIIIVFLAFGIIPVDGKVVWDLAYHLSGDTGITHSPSFAGTALPKQFEQNIKLGRGINIGNALEAPVEGTWGVTIEERFFKLIADKGFQSVRIPINWSTSNRTDIAFPYKVSDQLFLRVDWVIANALKNKLSVVICMHHYNELYANPTQHKQRFLAIWDQISKRYKNYPDSLYFELLNEPHDSLDATAWNKLFPEVLSVVRMNNPTRTVIVGPANYNDIYHLSQLALPNDTNLILTVHDYFPFQFTHQGADWVTGSDAWLGTTWDNTEGQRKQLQDGFQIVKDYADAHKLPVYVGEFGAYQEGDYYSRCQWTNYMSKTMEAFGFSWSYWEFCWIFGLYDRDTNTWRDKLTNALLTDPLSPTVKPTLGTNLVTGDFSTNISPWILNLSGSATATAKAENNACHVSIATPGNYSYNVQLTYPGLNLIKGKKYTVTFKASSSVNTQMTGYTAMNSSPWSGYSDYSILLLTSIPRQYTFEFTMAAATDQNSRLTFDVGSIPCEIYIGNVEVREQTFSAAEITVESKDNVTSIDNNTRLQMSAIVYPVNAVNKNVTWSVENITGKAAISNSGLLSAESSGTINVIAKCEDNADIGGTMQINIFSQTGINESKETEDMIFPNPATGDYLSVTCSDQDHQKLEVTLTNLNGKIIFSGFSMTGAIRIPIHHLPGGVYLVNVKTDVHQVTYKSVILQQ